MNERRYDKDGEAFEDRTRRAFDQSVEAMDAETLSRLNRARQAALAGGRRDGLRAGWLPVASAAAVAVLAVALWPGQAPEAPVGGATVVAEETEDLEIVLQDDSLDMLAELEFYDWVDSAEGFRSEPAGSGNIG